MEAPRQCQGAARGSQEGPGGAKQESQRLPGDAQSSLGAAWEGSGTCLGDLQGQFRSKFGSQTRCFCCIFFCFFPKAAGCGSLFPLSPPLQPHFPLNFFLVFFPPPHSKTAPVDERSCSPFKTAQKRLIVEENARCGARCGAN